ncbi:tetratricopeptide repeat protein [Neptuniibacter caesariensis]|uniref:Tetratricopeptide n=1 Tax=Neptuniibacter caesariensis TaxID=207954 RepID=A0A7U8GQ38_NEPCE|nr:tetratricopeptide repeat protein [Neptuniibacter caesariensis]EAR59922.1 Tetratricopeptide [Oceanospirillum sp. MED92] [Neptuniibacter caesariensis]
MFNKKLKVLMLVSCLALTACQSADEKVAVYVANAKEHIAKGDYEAAHIEFRNALQINPNHVEALYEVTKVFEQKKDWAKIHRYLERVIELQPDHVDALVAIGGIELTAQQLDKALERSEKAMRVAPGSAKVRSFHSVVLFKLGDAEGGVREALESLKIDPENIDAILLLASERLKAGDSLGALDYLNEADKQDNILVQLMKVRAFNEQKNLAGATQTFEELIKQYPQDEKYYLALAKQFLLFGEREKADQVLQRALTDLPDNIEVKLSYANFLKEFYGLGRAVALIKQELIYHPEDLKLNFALVELYEQSPHGNDSKELLLKIAAFSNQEARLKALNHLAKIEYQAGNLSSGDQYVKQVLVLDKSNQEAIVLNAQRSMVKGDLAKAISTLREVLRDNPSSSVILGLLGQAHEAQGKIELALDHYSQAYEVDSGNKLILESYAKILLSQRQYTKLESVIEKYLHLNPRDINALKISAQVKLTLRKWGEAQAIADRIDKLNIEADEAEQIRGAALLGQKRNLESIEAFERAYEASQSKVKPMRALVGSYVAAKQIDNAVSFLKSVLEKDTDNREALSLLAQVYFLIDKREEAEKLLVEGMNNYPKEGTFYRQLSGFLSRESRISEALEVLDRGIVNVDDSLSLELYKAGLQENRGDFLGAIKTYEKLLLQKPNFDIAANNLAVILSSDEHLDLKRAKSLAKRFRNSKIPYFLDTLGWIYYLEGDTNNALYYHESAVEAMPEFAEFRYHLGMSYRAAGESVRAKQELEKALELAKSETHLWEDEVSKIVDQM